MHHQLTFVEFSPNFSIQKLRHYYSLFPYTVRQFHQLSHYNLNDNNASYPHNNDFFQDIYQASDPEHPQSLEFCIHIITSCSIPTFVSFWSQLYAENF